MATLIVPIILSLAAAAPIADAPTNIPPTAEPSYVPEPRGRGTVQLLLSCVLTLVICIWTSIHPNIIKNPSTIRRLKEKATYVILGLFSPEIVLALALKEYGDTTIILCNAHFAGAAAYAKSVAENVRAATGENPGDAVESALIAVDAAVSTAREAERVAIVNANAFITQWITNRSRPTAQMSDREKETPLNSVHSANWDEDHWKKAREKQSAALVEAKNLKIAVKKHAAESRTTDLPWTTKVYNALLRFWANVVKLWWCIWSTKPVKYKIDRENAYFAMMGGYTFCPEQGLPDAENELTLAPKALAYLLRQGFITTADLASLRPEIADKGKSDMLAKFLVCMQAAWMVFNCISRKIAGLPVTLLELNVMMHVVCALVVYICWWKKPHDAGRAISLSQTLIDCDLWALVYTMDKYGPLLRCSMEEPEQLREEGVVNDIETSDDVIGEKSPAGAELLRNNKGFHLSVATATERELRICASAARKMRQLIKDGSKAVCSIPGPYPLCTPRVTMLYEPRFFEAGQGSTIILFLLCLLYGGVHATAWNSHFPTPTERTLWRISSIFVGAPGFGLVAFEIIRLLSDSKTDRYTVIRFLRFCMGVLAAFSILAAFGGSIYGIFSITRGSCTGLRGFLLFLLILVCMISFVGVLCIAAIFFCCNCLAKWDLVPGGLVLFAAALPVAVLYCGARAYIIIESFISMRSLPVGAYSTFSWENFWPHI